MNNATAQLLQKGVLDCEKELFINKLSLFLSLDQSQLPDAWQKLQKELDAFLKDECLLGQQPTEGKLPDQQLNLPKDTQQKLHTLIQSYLKHNNQIENSATETSEDSEMSHIYDDVFLSGNEDNVYDVRERSCSFFSPSTNSKVHHSNASHNYIPGGRYPSTDLECLFSEDDWDDEAFGEGSDSDGGFSFNTNNISFNHPLRLLSSTALKRDTLVNHSELKSNKKPKNQIFTTTNLNTGSDDLPEVLFKPHQKAVNLHISHPDGNESRRFMTSDAEEPLACMASPISNIYESLKFNSSPVLKPIEITDDPHCYECVVIVSNNVYDDPMSESVTCIQPSEPVISVENESEQLHVVDELAESHIYSSIDKTLSSSMLIQDHSTKKTDSGVFCVSFGEPCSSSSPASDDNSLNNSNKKQHSDSQSVTQTSEIAPKDYTQSQAYTNRPFSKMEDRSSFRKHFTGRFSLRLKKSHHESEIGSVAVACTKDERGYYQIPFDQLDTPKIPQKSNHGSRRSFLKPETSLRNRLTQFGSSIRRGISFKKH